MTIAGPHILYRCYSADWDLLYIGITNNIDFRFYIHGNESPWWRQMAAYATEDHFQSRAELEDAERAAILAEVPKYNVMHNDNWHKFREPEPPSRETWDAMNKVGQPFTFRMTDESEPAK